MKRSWKKFGRRAAACAIGGSTALSSAASYAAIAFDNASDPVYADGWQSGDNGGSGFTAWDFSSSLTFSGTYYGQYTNSTFHAIDDGLRNGTHYSNPFNNIGRAWDIGRAPDNNGVPQAGRGFSLGIGETLKVVFDNPTRREFFKGYTISLHGGTGGHDGNISYGGAPSTLGGTPVKKMSFGTFEYFTNGAWRVTDAGSPVTGVFDTDTAAAGALFSVKRTGANTYDLLVNSFGPGADFAASRTFLNSGAEVDWIEFEIFSGVTDTGTPPTTATDFYIRSMEIVPVPEPGAATLLLLGAIGIVGRTRRRSAG